MTADGKTPGSLPGVLGHLEPARRAELRAAFRRRREAGDSEARIVGDLAMACGIAPSFVRVLVAGADAEGENPRGS